MCTPGSSAPRRVARHSRDKQNPSTNAAPTKRRRSSSRRETSLETAKAIGPWPLRAPSPTPRTATQLSPHTTSRATWDSGISLFCLGVLVTSHNCSLVNIATRGNRCRVRNRVGGGVGPRYRKVKSYVLISYRSGPNSGTVNFEIDYCAVAVNDWGFDVQYGLSRIVLDRQCNRYWQPIKIFAIEPRSVVRRWRNRIKKCG